MITKIFAGNKVMVTPGYQPVQSNGDPWFFDLNIPNTIPAGNLFKTIDKNQFSQLNPITKVVTDVIGAEPENNPSVVELQRTIDNSQNSQEQDSFESNENSQNEDYTDELRPVLNLKEYQNLSNKPQPFLDYIRNEF